MTHKPRTAGGWAIAAGWPDLAEELERWGEAGREATLWWRDDDAIAASAELDRLVPLALAVIPALADAGLAARLAAARQSEVAVLQHGWRHTDHADGGRKSEFP